MKMSFLTRKFLPRLKLRWWMTPIFFWLCVLAFGVTFFTLYERFAFLE